MEKPTAIYALVSSDRQKEQHTIARQTAVLIDYAQPNACAVPPERVFQDEGYSGVILVRSGLEALRDLAAEGQIGAVLGYGGRLSPQICLSGSARGRAIALRSSGVEQVLLKSPAGSSPEDQLLIHFQGMIAEYERAQIAEHSRRGKRHRGQQETVNVLSGAPYGCCYVRKSDSSSAYYEVIEAEAQTGRPC